MLGIRTPTKNTISNSPKKAEVQVPVEKDQQSMGDTEVKTKALSKKTPGPSKAKSLDTMGSPPPKPTYPTRLAEGRACLSKAKLNLGNSRNIKTEIKEAINTAVERLYQLIKESEAEKSKGRGGKEEEEPLLTPLSSHPVNCHIEKELLKKMDEHLKLITANTENMESLKDTLLSHQKVLEGTTYANVVAGGGSGGRGRLPEQATLHSIVVTSNDEMETGDEVLGKVRKAVNAKDGWIKIEKVRKAKDRKIIIGLETKEERDKIKDRLQKAGVDLNVEEVKNKDPLLILKNVLSENTDEDVLGALRNQNRGIFGSLDNEENRMEVKYRRRTRNPHIGHIIVSVSPTIWRRAVEIGTVHIDLQRIRVEDQTPLVQCTRCLGFGHGKRFCKEPVDLCSHCGGPHVRTECPDWLSDTAPACRNCMKAKIEYGIQHNAFSHDCPVRHKWDEIARSTVAYC